MRQKTISDYLIILLSVALVSTGVYFFLFKSNITQDINKQSKIGKISSLDSGTKVKIPGTMSWIEPKINDDVYNGEQVFTDEISQLTIAFDENSSLKVSPGSLIKINQADGEFKINLIKGSLKVQGTPIQTTIYNLQTGETVKAKENLEVSAKPVPVNTIAKKEEPKDFLRHPREGEKIDPDKSQQLHFDLNETVIGNILIYNQSGKQVYQQRLQRANSVEMPRPKPGVYTAKLKDLLQHDLGSTTFEVLPFKAPSFAPIPAQSPYYYGQEISIKWNGSVTHKYQVRLPHPLSSLILRH